MSTLGAEVLGTLASLKKRMGVEASHKDELLTGALKAASAAIASYLGRRLEYDDEIVELREGYGTTEMILDRAPIWGDIAEVLFDDVEVPADDYECLGENKKSGVLVSLTGWLNTSAMRAEGAGGESLGGHERLRYQVTYTAGWLTPNQATPNPNTLGVERLPADIEEACYITAMVIAESYGVSPKDFPMGDSGLPKMVEGMLRPYRFHPQG